jgi:ferredoxin-NADP reductase
LADLGEPAIPARSGWQPATVERVTPVSPGLRAFTLRPALWRPFLAGQHVELRLTAPDGYQARRSYSVASAPEQAGAYEIGVARLDGGEVSPFLHDVVQPGDALEMRGPRGGYFTWTAADGGPLLLAGGGSGVVPLLSVVRHRAAVAPEVPAVLLLSARSWAEVPWRDELLARERDEPGFTLVLLLTREAPRRPGDLGRRVDRAAVEAALARLRGPPHLAYACGSTGFVEATAGALVAAGVPAERVRTERYGGG